MPWGGHPGGGGLLYNTDMLEAAGVKPPDDTWTMDTLLDAAKKMTSRSAGGPIRSAIALGSVEFLALNDFVGAFGGDFLSPDGKELDDGHAAVQGRHELRARVLVTHKAAPMPGPDVNTVNLFAGGKIAMTQAGYTAHFSPGEKVIAGKFKWGIDLMPKGPAGKRGTA